MPLKFSRLLIRPAVFILLLTSSLLSFAQTDDGASSARQMSQYLQNTENDPNGVPNDSAWYAQPWIWAIVAAVLILLIAFITRGSSRKNMESDTEGGLRHN